MVDDGIQEYKLKLVLLGDGEVGKTSLIRRYVYDEYSDSYIMTIGAKTSKKILNLTNPSTGEPVRLIMMISDIMGQTDVGGIHDAYIFGAKGAIIVCDLTRLDTLYSLDPWVARVRKVVGEIPMVFVANKYDLIFDAEFDFKKVLEVSDKYQCPAVVSSAKTGENVEELFNALGETLLAMRTG